MILDMELGRPHQRILRALLLSPEGIDRSTVLRALYADREDQAERVARGVGISYALELMRELRLALRDQGLGLAVTERRLNKPWRWAIAAEQEEPELEERVLLPHIVAVPALEQALRKIPRMARYIIMLLAAAGEKGLGRDEIARKLWPIRERRPSDTVGAIAAHLSLARPHLRRYDLNVVSRPRAGVTARRYLVRTR